MGIHQAKNNSQVRLEKVEQIIDQGSHIMTCTIVNYRIKCM